MDGTVHIVKLDQKPCVVHYLEHYNKFIVGTYELFSSIEDAHLKLNSHLDDHQLRKTLEGINYRAGKLILLRGNDVSVPSIEYEFDCEAGGGVFDTKVKYNKVDSSYSIYAAHSNGTIGVYKLALHCGNKICLKEHIRVPNSKMLTSVDIFPDFSSIETEETELISSVEGLQIKSSSSSSGSTTSNKKVTRVETSVSVPTRLVVGDAEGYITVLNREEPIQANVAQGDSVWQVKTLRLASGREVIIVCAENSSWSIYVIDLEGKKLVMLYRNEQKDFTAGVTSIYINDVVQSFEYDLVEVLLGSYDETIQIYHVKINHDGISKPDVCHKNTCSIEGGGIWRIKPFRGNNRKKLCIAAMFAGSYVMGLDALAHSFYKMIDTKCLKLTNKPLHYDIDVSTCNTTFCIVDFNNSLCLFKTTDR